MEVSLLGQAYRIAKGGLDSVEQLRQTVIRSLGVAQVEDPRAELARAGRRFAGGNQVIANGIAPVAAIPTTTATVALCNMEDAGGAAIMVNRVSLWLGSGTPAAGATLFAAISPIKLATAPTTMATGWAWGSSSGSSRASKALWATAVTMPNPSNKPIAWVALLSSLQSAAANVGQGDNTVDLEGQFLIPPGYALGFAVLSGAGTTPLYGISVTASETETDLE